MRVRGNVRRTTTTMTKSKKHRSIGTPIYNGNKCHDDNDPVALTTASVQSRISFHRRRKAYLIDHFCSLGSRSMAMNFIFSHFLPLLFSTFFFFFFFFFFYKLSTVRETGRANIERRFASDTSRQSRTRLRLL